MYHRFGWDFTPQFHPDRLDEPLKHKDPLKIFVGSVTDVGGDFIEREWMEAVLDVVQRAPWHTFQFLTKRPHGLWSYHFPPNAWVGTTITQGGRRIKTPIGLLSLIDAPTRFVSFEPLLGLVYPGSSFAFLEWIIIGPQTGPGAQVPEREWIDVLLETADAHGVPVFMKKALKPYIESWGLEWRREFPQ